jgi:hypothetical protein
MKRTVKEQLNAQDYQQLVGALPRIASLIGGSDGDFDSNEKNWATKLVSIRGYNSPEALEMLYEDASPLFGDQLATFFNGYSTDTALRNEELSRELEAVNAVIRKLDPETAYLVYSSLRSFAWHVARASGGFLGFASISKDEEKWVSLPMLTPVGKPEIEEEE